MAVLFILIVFAICVGGCWALFRGFAELFIKDKKERYIDRTTHIHNHYYDHRSVHIDKEIFKGLKK